MAWKMVRPGQRTGLNSQESSVHATKEEAEEAADRLAESYRQAGIGAGGTGLGADLIRDSIVILEVDDKTHKKKGWLW
jgi:hypothetical protein